MVDGHARIHTNMDRDRHTHRDTKSASRREHPAGKLVIETSHVFSNPPSSEMNTFNEVFNKMCRQTRSNDAVSELGVGF